MSQRQLCSFACVAEIMQISHDRAVALARKRFCWYRLCGECKCPKLNSKSNFNLVPQCPPLVSRDFVPLKCCGPAEGSFLRSPGVSLHVPLNWTLAKIPGHASCCDICLWRIHCVLDWSQQPENKSLAAAFKKWWFWTNDLEVKCSVATQWTWMRFCSDRCWDSSFKREINHQEDVSFAQLYKRE